MARRNPSSPWNPGRAAEISPEEYECQVVAWLRAAGANLESFEVQHRRHLPGSGGEYEFDAVAELTLLEGARIVLLVECKRYSRPVERENVMALWAKLQDVKAHKAMMFATCGYQSGAIKYADTYGIATVTFVKGSFLYETKSFGDDEPEPPPWVDLPRYAGLFMSLSDKGTIQQQTIERKEIGALNDWLTS